VHNVIMHIISHTDWTAARAAGECRPPSLAEQGFVHCSDPGTVHLPANTFYRGRSDLLLVIDPTKVPVRWEPGDPPQPGGPWFPHVYGPIPLDAVVATHEFPPSADGTFRLPAALAEVEAT
jgi:uncharacterized protein (DUF952 family)